MWLLWAAIAFEIDLKLPAGLEALDDDLVAILALHGEKLGRWTLGSNQVWTSWMTHDELQGRHWLVAYEAAVRDWLPHFNYRDGHPHFSFLSRHGVRFYSDVRVKDALLFAAFAPTPGGAISTPTSTDQKKPSSS